MVGVKKNRKSVTNKEDKSSMTSSKITQKSKQHMKSESSSIFILNQEFNKDDLDDEMGPRDARSIEMSDFNSTTSADSVSLNEEYKSTRLDHWFSEDLADDDDMEIDSDENEQDYYYTEKKSEDTNKSQAIRLDLMNDIKDEMLDEAVKRTRGATQVAEAGQSDKERANESYADFSDGETNYEFEESQAAGSSIKLENVNLKYLKVCIDDIEELVDKSNNKCFVFVIQVWNIQPTGLNPSGSLPTWTVKRKHDEFYVLDSKLKEFHGDLLGVDAQNFQTMTLPSKKIIPFFGNNSKNLEYLSSIKQDCTKYLQVKL